MGTLGAGNHYAEVQVVDEIFDKNAGRKMGIDRRGQVVVMIHSGSRGLGHQVATGLCFFLDLVSILHLDHGLNFLIAKPKVIILLKRIKLH